MEELVRSEPLKLDLLDADGNIVFGANESEIMKMISQLPKETDSV